MIAVGLLRFGLDLPEAKVAALLAVGWNVPLPQSSISRLSIEFLVRWRMLCEERLPPLLAGRAPLLLQVDGTVVPGAPVTFRAREARTGATLWAEQLEAESREEVVRFLRIVKERYGTPTLLIRDLSPTIREAAIEVFPTVPQQEDHWHYLSVLGPLGLPDYEPLRHGLLLGEALAHLAQWARKLPVEGGTLDDLERVWVRLALEWVDTARQHPGGFPWRLPYLEVARRMRRVVDWSEQLLRANTARGIGVPEVAGLKHRLRGVLEREAVKFPLGRLDAEVVLWEEIRRAMRAERDRRSRDDLGPLAAADIVEVRRQIEEAGGRFAARGDWAVAIWEKVAAKFAEHERFLWVVVPGLGEVVRSTVALERAHRDDRQRVRHRTGQEATGAALGEFGALLAFWSNARCRWFVEEGLTGVNLWAEFARQDPGEVRRRLAALPREGCRPRVAVPKKKVAERLEAFVRLLTGPAPLEPALAEWAASIGSELMDHSAPAE